MRGCGEQRTARIAKAAVPPADEVGRANHRLLLDDVAVNPVPRFALLVADRLEGRLPQLVTVNEVASPGGDSAHPHDLEGLVGSRHGVIRVDPRYRLEVRLGHGFDPEQRQIVVERRAGVAWVDDRLRRDGAALGVPDRRPVSPLRADHDAVPYREFRAVRSCQND